VPKGVIAESRGMWTGVCGLGGLEEQVSEAEMNLQHRRGPTTSTR
jgi:hypothetical protein